MVVNWEESLHWVMYQWVGVDLYQSPVHQETRLSQLKPFTPCLNLFISYLWVLLFQYVHPHSGISRRGGGERLTVKQDLMHPQTINADTEQELNMRHSAQTQSPYSHECVFSAAQNPLERRLLPPVLNKTLHKLIAHLSRLPTDCYSYIFNCAAAVKAAWFLLWPFHVSSRCSVSSGVSVNIFYSIRKRADAHVKKERRLLVLDGQRTYIPQKVQTNAANQFHT